MAFTLPILHTLRQKKPDAIEPLLKDPSRDEEALESPTWHEDALREAERRVAAGNEVPLDWRAAKKELRWRFE